MDDAGIAAAYEDKRGYFENRTDGVGDEQAIKCREKQYEEREATRCR
ncbi:MAG: hypothetical protein OXL97_06345 [Chloroflexota bacterium]|nr:hypothetical protein [Chloroflexota bacterium]